MEVREMLLLGPSSFLAHSSLLSSHCEGALYFEVHLNLVQRLKIYVQVCQFLAKSYRRAFPMLLVRCPFQPNLSEGDFLYIKADSLLKVYVGSHIRRQILPKLKI
jgi:hypothetical protein